MQGVAAKNDASYNLGRVRASATGQTTIAASTATTSLPNGRIVTALFSGCASEARTKTRTDYSGSLPEGLGPERPSRIRSCRGRARSQHTPPQDTGLAHPCRSTEHPLTIYSSPYCCDDRLNSGSIRACGGSCCTDFPIPYNIACFHPSPRSKSARAFSSDGIREPGVVAPETYQNDLLPASSQRIRTC